DNSDHHDQRKRAHLDRLDRYQLACADLSDDVDDQRRDRDELQYREIAEKVGAQIVWPDIKQQREHKQAHEGEWVPGCLEAEVSHTRWPLLEQQTFRVPPKQGSRF